MFLCRRRFIEGFSRMALVKDFGKSIRTNSCVSQGGLNPDVPEENLDDFNRSSVIVQVGCKRPPECVRSDVLQSGTRG